MKLIAKQDFSWAHRGVLIEEFKKGQEIETDDPDLIKVSTDQGWTAKSRKAAGQSPSVSDGDPQASGDAAEAEPAVTSAAQEQGTDSDSQP